MKELIRMWRSGAYRLNLYDTGSRDQRGQTILAYRFRHSGKTIFEGEDFSGSPLNADDSNETMACLLGFLSLRPGEIDAGYFDKYTPEQLAWVNDNGEDLSFLCMRMEERADNKRKRQNPVNS